LARKRSTDRSIQMDTWNLRREAKIERNSYKVYKAKVNTWFIIKTTRMICLKKPKPCNDTKKQDNDVKEFIDKYQETNQQETSN